MRRDEALALGAVTGAVVAWLWRQPLVEALDETARELRTKAADGIQAVEKTIRPAA